MCTVTEGKLSRDNIWNCIRFVFLRLSTYIWFHLSSQHVMLSIKSCLSPSVSYNLSTHFFLSSTALSISLFNNSEQERCVWPALHLPCSERTVPLRWSIKHLYAAILFLLYAWNNANLLYIWKTKQIYMNISINNYIYVSIYLYTVYNIN